MIHHSFKPASLITWAIASTLITPQIFADPTSERAKRQDNPPNILFIAIDDWRNDLHALGVEHVQTPYMDRFAQNSRLFSHHYVQVPTCGASRAALISSLRGPQTGSGNHAIYSRQDRWGDRVLPRWFRKHGYQTLALGKITHHPGGLRGGHWNRPPEELPNAWDRSWVPETPWESPLGMMHGYANGVPRDRGESPAWEAYDGDDKSYPDGWIAAEAIEVLDELVDSDSPWFFGVGFFKPHLPFAAPQKYFDLYDPDKIPAPADTTRHPEPSSWRRSNELMGNYGHDGQDPYTDEAYARVLRHAYAAATTYVDAQVGKVLQHVAELGLMDDLIIVIWSDHGFALGEHGAWGKHHLYEAAVRAPMLIRYPGMPEMGTTSHATVETIDLFPTLTDLAGLPTPDGLAGVSLRPLLENPEAPSLKPAFSHFRGEEAVRDERWRLVVQGSVKDDNIRAIELFDFKNSVEGVRVDHTDYPEVVERLLEKLRNLD